MILFLVRLLICILVFLICGFFYRSRDFRAEFLSYREEKIKAMQEDSVKSITYGNTYKYLLSRGAMFYVGSWVTPFDYVLAKIVIAIIFLFLGLLIHPLVGFLMAVFGFAFPKLAIDIKNKKDNEEMLDELAQVYSTVSLQVKSGVWLGNALHECYLITKHARLKQALWELSKEVQASSDIEKASETFRNKFENPYVDTFAKSLEQSLQTGEAEVIFSDISKQLVSIHEAIYMKEENHVNNIMMVSITLVFLAGIIGIVFVLLNTGIDGLTNIF